MYEAILGIISTVVGCIAMYVIYLFAIRELKKLKDKYHAG